jgi:Methyltransferase domain
MGFDFTARHIRSGLAEKLAFAIRESFLGLFSVNLAALQVLLTKGWRSATQLVSHNYKLYSGYGLTGLPPDMAWRSDCILPKMCAGEIFPEIDFMRSPELIFPFPTILSISTIELSILAILVRHFQPQRVVEFGTAEGRTTLNLAVYLPPGGEVVTIDLPSGSSTGKWRYLKYPASEHVRQLLGDVSEFDWTPYRHTAGLVFSDACDLYPQFVKETAAAFEVVAPGGVILWHDYGYGRYRTRYLNELRRKWPICHIEGTHLACLRVAELPE